MDMRKYMTFVFTILFVFSCTDVGITDSVGVEGVENSEIILTPEEFVSIAYDSPKELSREEVLNIIFDWQCINKEIEIGGFTRGSYMSKASIKKKYYISDSNNTIVESATARSHALEEINVPIFEVELLKNSGEKDFAIICGDERAPKVLFYANNYNSSFEMNVETRYLLELSKKSVLLDIEQVEQLKSEKRDFTLSKIAKELNMSKEQISYASIQDRITTTDNVFTRNNPVGGVDKPTTGIVAFVNPMSKVTWSQEYPYNILMPKARVFDGNSGEYDGNHLVGCANVAIGTLLSIIKPAMIVPTNQSVDWDYVTSTGYIYLDEDYPEYSSPPELVSMITNLLAQIAEETNSTPAYEIKTLIDENGNKYEKKVITGTETTVSNTINYIRKRAIFSGDENTKFNIFTAKESLFDKKPVFLFGQGHFLDNNGNIVDEDNKPGHAWLIDGFIVTKKTGQVACDSYLSVNMGWGTKISKGYFDIGKNLEFCDVVFRYNKDRLIVYYAEEQSMIYNIKKK